MRKAYARRIDSRTTKLLRELDLYETPVDVHAVAIGLGANVIVDDLDDDVSGFLLIENGTATIGINGDHHSNRQRFTLAHECGHLFLHAGRGDQLWVDRTLFFRDGRASTGEQFAEIEANQFAAGLLMPEGLIKTNLSSELPVSEADVAKMAMQFCVSERAMTLRLISLGFIESVAA